MAMCCLIRRAIDRCDKNSSGLPILKGVPDLSFSFTQYEFLAESCAYSPRSAHKNNNKRISLIFILTDY
jgi:hypothetical protein